jgi:hypothetical protein
MPCISCFSAESRTAHIFSRSRAPPKATIVVPTLSPEILWLFYACIDFDARPQIMERTFSFSCIKEFVD